eukprot:COSAG06_NODE_1695_length_8658_cov_9.171279_11_plen_51_part_01
MLHLAAAARLQGSSLGSERAFRMSLLLRRAASSIGRSSAAFRVVGRALLPT